MGSLCKEEKVMAKKYIVMGYTTKKSRGKGLRYRKTKGKTGEYMQFGSLKVFKFMNGGKK